MASIRILSGAGDFAGARQKLAALRASSEGHRLGSGELRQIIPVALLVHDEASALHFLADMCPATSEIRFAVADAQEHSVVSMHVAGRSATFIVSNALFSHEHGEFLLQRLIDVFPILANYLGSSSRSDGTVAINLGDAGERPGLAFCANRSGYFLIPDSIFLDTRAYNGMRAHFQREPVAWPARAPTAFWRGTTTGQPEDASRSWRSLPRIRLCEIGAANPDLIDAGITKTVQIDDPEAGAFIANAGLSRPYVPAEFFQRYKYQIDIDGNTASWPGLFIKLLTGGVVLKVPSRAGFEQWYYDRLKPWENFVPLATDMCDLPEKVRWLLAHDDTAQAIGEAGRRLAEELTYEHEISRAVPIVAAAMRDASGAPLLDIDFAANGDGIAHLRDGWLPPDHDGVDAAAFQSRIDLPRPSGIGGFILGLDVSPIMRGRQRLAIIMDGEVMAQQAVSARTTIYLPLARKILKNRGSIDLTLLHPDAAAGSPGDARIGSIRLHRVFVKTAGQIDPDASLEHIEVLGELRAMDLEQNAHDLNGPVPLPPPRAKRLTIHTYHGTIVYADVATGRLRHGAADAVPHNLLFISGGSRGVLARSTATGQLRIVRLRPEGTLAVQADRAALDAEAYADEFSIELVAGGPGKGVALRAAGMVLCAEGNGGLTLGRVKIAAWEKFGLTPSPSGEPQVAAAALTHG